MSKTLTSRLLLACTATLALAALAGLGQPHAAHAATLEGEVLFGGGSVTSGGSGTVSLGVPTGAACQGSGPSGYRWETFLVSSSIDPGDLTFASGPNPVSGSLVVPLYDLNGLQVSTKFPASSPLGLISGVPAISFSNTVDGNGLVGLTPGDYRLGIACTFGGAVQEYWEAYLAITADAQDQPLGIRWTVTEAPTPTTTTTTTTTSTTTTTLPGATTTTEPGGSTTSTPGGIDGTSTTVLYGSGSGVPETGASSTAVAALAIAVLVAGRFVVLSARRVKVLPSP